MKFAIIGSRSFSNYEYLKEKLSGIPITHIVSGGAVGADSLAERYAQERGIPITVIKPDYAQHGKAATHIRNREIVNASDAVIAFWNGQAGGTKSVIAYAEDVGKAVEINYTPDMKDFSRKIILGEAQSQAVVKGMYATLDPSSNGGRRLKVLKENIINSGQNALFKAYVEDNFNPEAFRHFKGKENAFIAVPSTTGRNLFPDALALALQKAFGGEAFIGDHARPVHGKQSKTLDGLQKIVQFREYTIIDPGLSAERLAGKNVVLVDDVATTGASIDGMRQALYERGIKVNAVATLCQSELRLATGRDFERIAQKASDFHPDPSLPLNARIDDIASRLEQCFEGCLKHKMNYLERDITGFSYNRIQNRKELYHVLSGEIERIRGHGRRILPVLLQKRSEADLDKRTVGGAPPISISEESGKISENEYRIRESFGPTEGGSAQAVKEDGGFRGVGGEAAIGEGGSGGPGESMNFNAAPGLKSGLEIAESIRQSRSLVLPPSIISAIDSGISEGKLKPDATHELICASIDRVKNQGFSWKESGNPAAIHAAYVKDALKLSEGDVFIRAKASGAARTFDAYRVTGPANSKYLGSEKSYPAMKGRVEQYVTGLYIRDKINETLSLADASPKVREKMPGYGLAL